MTSRPTQGRTRPRPRVPRNTLNRERVLAAAVDLLDHAGPDAFTMRALAERLGVATMAVYSHFSAKEEIIEAVRERLLAEVELPPLGPVEEGGGSRAEVRELWRAAYRLLADHPSVLRLLATRPVSGDEGTVFADRALGVLLRAGLDRADAARCYTTLMQFTVGSALWASRGREHRGCADANCRTSDEDLGSRLRSRLAGLSPDRYPCLVDLAPELEAAARDGMAQYERGLDALLTGLLDKPMAHRA